MRLISTGFFVFFFIVLSVYNLSPRRIRWAVLCAAGLGFYLTAGIFAFIYIIFISLSSYIFALFLQKYQKEGGGFALPIILAIGVIFVLGFWATLKLTSSGGGFLLPLGISFYSLRIISYLVDIKRGKVSAEKSFFKYLLFVSYFPLVLQGPVARFDEISESLFSGRRASLEESLSGLILLLWGVFKKVVIANTLSIPLSLIVRENYSGAYILFLIIFYSAEIYSDFSGGIDIVRGASFMLGIALPKNFDRPFASVTLREFWNRWHISLGEWFETYVFYPLSLSRPMQRLSKRARQRLGARVGRKIPIYIATMLTWLLTGLWHGARTNYIAWGLINGALVLVSQELSPLYEKLYIRYPTLKEKRVFLDLVGRVRVFLIIGSVRLLDLYSSVSLTSNRLFTVFYDLESYQAFFSGGVLSVIGLPELLAVSAALVPVFFVSEFKIKARSIAKRPALAAASVFSLALISLLFGSYGEGFWAGDFIYSQF